MTETEKSGRPHWRRIFESGASFLEHLSKYGILIAIGVFLWTWDAKRVESAWEVLYSAHGQGGDGGRIKALELLNGKGKSLHGCDLSKAYLAGVRLGSADLTRADLSDVDLEHADLRGARLVGADLQRADLRGALLEGADLSDTQLEGALLDRSALRAVSSLHGAKLRGRDLRGFDLSGVDLR